MIDLLRHAVPQRDAEYGCIPTGYEILLSAAGVGGIDFDTFQEDFNLQARGIGENNFGSVGAAITQRYPHVTFDVKEFPPGAGAEKAAFLENRLRQSESVLASLHVGEKTANGMRVHVTHIMPLLALNGDQFVFLAGMSVDGKRHLLSISRTHFLVVMTSPSSTR